MANENVGEETTKTFSDETVVEETSETTEASETTEQPQEKREEAPEAKQSRLRRQLQQHEKKHGLEQAKEEVKETPKESSQPNPDYDKLFLEVRQVTEEEDKEFVQAWAKNSGQTLEATLKDESVISKLGAMKAARVVATASAVTSKRSSNSAVDEVQYHLAKNQQTGEMPKDQELAAKVVNAKMDLEKKAHTFSDEMFVG